MAQFLLILQESPDAFAAVPPEEIRRVIARYEAWRASIHKQGHLLGSNKLADDGGRSMTREGGTVRVVDGPFAEAKEIIGGYFLIEAAGYDEAVRIASDCPHLEFGRIELRQVDLLDGMEGE